MTTDNEFDGLLHDALGEYREAEPLAGMEERVLRRISAQSAMRWRGWWRWGLAAACALVLAVGVWLGVNNPTPPKEGGVGHPEAKDVAGAGVPDSANKELVTPHIPTEGKYGPHGGVGHPAGLVAIRVAEARPKVVESRVLPAQFPTSTPLTAEERAFVASLQKEPVAAAGATNGEITIAEIEIKPLAIGGLSSSENPGDKQ